MLEANSTTRTKTSPMKVPRTAETGSPPLKVPRTATSDQSDAVTEENGRNQADVSGESPDTSKRRRLPPGLQPLPKDDNIPKGNMENAIQDFESDFDGADVKNAPDYDPDQDDSVYQSSSDEGEDSASGSSQDAFSPGQYYEPLRSSSADDDHEQVKQLQI